MIAMSGIRGAGLRPLPRETHRGGYQEGRWRLMGEPCWICEGSPTIEVLVCEQRGCGIMMKTCADCRDSAVAGLEDHEKRTHGRDLQGEGGG